jgi:hypothetical protein
MICVILFCVSSIFYDFKGIYNNDLSFITSELKTDVKLVVGRKRQKHLEFELKDYPNFKFKITGASYRGISDDEYFLERFKMGNLISAGIISDDYEKKIAKTKELHLFDKYIHYSTIPVYQIKDSQNLFQININTVNKDKNESNYYIIGFLSVFGLLFLYLAFGNYRAYTRSNHQHSQV